jgi:dynein heavy chain
MQQLERPAFGEEERMPVIAMQLNRKAKF